MGVNLWGVIHGSRLFGRQMRDRVNALPNKPDKPNFGGHIVNIASAAAFAPWRVMPAYCTTKAAVLMLSECLRAELVGSRIGVTAVCPGFVSTDIVKNGTYVEGNIGSPEKLRQRGQKAIQLRNYPPEKVAERVVNAIIKNKAVVPVNFEGHLLHALSRISPPPSASSPESPPPGLTPPLTEPVHQSDDDSLLSDVRQVVQHERRSFDTPQPWCVPSMCDPIRKSIESRTANSRAICSTSAITSGGSPSRRSSGSYSQLQSLTGDRSVGRTDDVTDLPDGPIPDLVLVAGHGLFGRVEPPSGLRMPLYLDHHPQCRKKNRIGLTLFCSLAAPNAVCMSSNNSGRRDGATIATALRSAGHVNSGMGISSSSCPSRCATMRHPSVRGLWPG